MDFVLAKWHVDYAGHVAEYANNKKIADNLRNVFPHPYTLDDAKSYVCSCAESDELGQICRAIMINGKAVGSIGIFLREDVYCKSAEIGYWIGEPFWGKGIMSSAIEELCSMAFKQYDIVRIFAEPYAHNIGSRKALEKAGFEMEGIMEKSVFKNGAIFDSCIYALVK
jgi:ribosomal-protein-alanine N-acetyltransferase